MYHTDTKEISVIDAGQVVFNGIYMTVTPTTLGDTSRVWNYGETYTVIMPSGVVASANTSAAFVGFTGTEYQFTTQINWMRVTVLMGFALFVVLGIPTIIYFGSQLYDCAISLMHQAYGKPGATCCCCCYACIYHCGICLEEHCSDESIKCCAKAIDGGETSSDEDDDDVQLVSTASGQTHLTLSDNYLLRVSNSARASTSAQV